MSDIFGAAAARAQQKRAAEKRNGEITLQNNALVDLINERAKERAEREERAAAWKQHVDETLSEVGDLCNKCGRLVEDVTFNGEVIFVRRRAESIRLFVGKIDGYAELQSAAVKLLGSVMRC